MAAMFANTPRSGTSSSGHLVEFKAGRSNLVAGSTPEKRKVVAEKTKGLVFIKQSEDRLMHFCWKNRETGAITDDLIIFPGDTEFVRVKECPDGKVFMLKFKTSDERRLFWLQDSNPTADKGLVEKVNETLNHPPQGRGGRSAAGGSTSGDRAALATAAIENATPDELNALGSLDRQQLMQLLSFMNSGASGGAEGAGANTLMSLPTSQASAEHGNSSAGASGPGSSADLTSQLQSVLRGIQRASGGRGGGSGGNAQPSVNLSEIIAGERVLETVQSNTARLSPHLPAVDGVAPEQELRETVRTPQFRQAADVFGHALQTGQLGPVLQQFGVSPEATAAAMSGDLLEFSKKLTTSEGGQGSEAGNEASGPPDATSSSTAATASTTPAAPATPQGTPDSVCEPTPKRGKPDDDQMDLD